MTFKLTRGNNTAKVISDVDNLLTGFPVMSCGAQIITAIILFPIQQLTYDQNASIQIIVTVLWSKLVRA